MATATNGIATYKDIRSKLSTAWSGYDYDTDQYDKIPNTEQCPSKSALDNLYIHTAGSHSDTQLVRYAYINPSWFVYYWPNTSLDAWPSSAVSAGTLYAIGQAPSAVPASAYANMLNTACTNSSTSSASTLANVIKFDKQYLSSTGEYYLYKILHKENPDSIICISISAATNTSQSILKPVTCEPIGFAVYYGGKFTKVYLNKTANTSTGASITNKFYWTSFGCFTNKSA